MNGGYDAADTVLRLSLELGEKTLYLTGSGAKSLAKTLVLEYKWCKSK